MKPYLDNNQIFNEKVKNFEKNKLEEQIKSFNNQTILKTKLLNIDSAYRNKIPKNIYSSTNIKLVNNPIQTTKNSDIICINYPTHKFKLSDRIIIQNVQGKNKTLSNSLYFFNNFEYLFINFSSHNISTDFLNYNTSYKILIEIINDIGSIALYGNIPINAITGIFNVTLPSLVNNEKLIPLDILKILNVDNVYNLDKDWLLIKLPFNFIINGSTYFIPIDVFKISFLSIGGIPLEYINADFPITFEKLQGYHEIINLDSSNIYIKIPNIALNNDFGGGENIQIMLIHKTIEGFPNANDYKITLKQNFTNVIRIELISTEFPYIDYLITSRGINKNNKLYWKNYDDGNFIYEVELPEGNYDSTNLISIILNSINNVQNINSTLENPIYNIFEINLDSFTQEITFSSFKENKLPNSLNCSLISINNIKYVKLTIYHKGNFVEKEDTIIISNAIKIGTIIDSNFLNKGHKVYEINITDQTYSVLIGPLNQITNLTDFSLDGNGGPTIIIKTKSKFCFLFDRQDTVGKILGFKNVGEKNAITAFKTTISNFDTYIQSTKLNFVGDIDDKSDILNLAGKYYYILMYLNDFECILNSFNQPAAFAKILMSGVPGDIMFNTFIIYPLEFDFPIPSLDELSVKFTYPDGTLVDFRNINHSFTLRIIEKTIALYNTGKNSKDTTFLDTFIESKI
jgi:hypothetical protein